MGDGRRGQLAWRVLGGVLAALTAAQTPLWGRVSVTGRVSLVGLPASPRPADNSSVVVWLVDVNGGLAQTVSLPQGRSPYRVVQENKRFVPHVLVVPRGAEVEFPNHDPFFHNVFSLYEGKRFDLGLYEAGKTRRMTFDRPGISYLFCNIHPEMSAVILALDTPYYGVSDIGGNLSIRGVPPGLYELHVWHERSSPADLKRLDREITISDSFRTLGELRVKASSPAALKHKNKYGRDYDPPVSSSPLYGYGNP